MMLAQAPRPRTSPAESGFACGSEISAYVPASAAFAACSAPPNWTVPHSATLEAGSVKLRAMVSGTKKMKKIKKKKSTVAGGEKKKKQKKKKKVRKKKRVSEIPYRPYFAL